MASRRPATRRTLPGTGGTQAGHGVAIAIDIDDLRQVVRPVGEPGRPAAPDPCGRRGRAGRPPARTGRGRGSSPTDGPAARRSRGLGRPLPGVPRARTGRCRARRAIAHRPRRRRPAGLPTPGSTTASTTSPIRPLCRGRQQIGREVGADTRRVGHQVDAGTSGGCGPTPPASRRCRGLQAEIGEDQDHAGVHDASPAPPGRRGPPQATSAAAWSAASANRPKQVAPLPDIRASRQSGWRRSAASTSPIAGAAPRAGGSRSLRLRGEPCGELAGGQDRRQRRPRWRRPRERARTRRPSPAAGRVDQQERQVRQAGTGSSRSPMPRIRAAGRQADRHVGAERQPSAASLASASGSPHSRRSRARSLPHRPSRRRCRRHRQPLVEPEPGAGRAAAAASPRAARRTRLSSPPAQPGGERPAHLQGQPSAGSSAARRRCRRTTTRLSSSW